MTDLEPITRVGDAWVNSSRTGLNYGSTNRINVKSGERRGFLLPPLQSIAGRTVLSATLVGRVAAGHVAQTYTVAPVTARWSPGRITWANQPGVNSAAAVTLAVSALPDKGLVEFDVTTILSAVAAGTEWFGLRIVTNSTTAGQRFYATDSGDPAWELHVTLSDAPEQPSNLRPDGGAVPTGEPILAWDFVDLGGDSTDQAELRVQVDTPAVGVEPDEVTPDFDSGWVAGVDPEFDLSTAVYTPPASPPGSTFWRVQVKDAAGEISDWSDWASFTVAALPTLVIDSPTGPFGDPSPRILAHLSSGTLTSWKGWVTGPDRSDIRYRSGVDDGPIDWNVPVRHDGRRVLRDDEQGWVHLKVWDDVDRAVAVGQSPYIEAWIPVTWDDDLGVQPPTGLMVSQVAARDPRQRWTWNRTEAATAWLIQVDGNTVERLEPDDVTANGGTYSWTDSGQVSPLRPHTLGVRAIEGGTGRSTAVTVVEHATEVGGVWLIPEDTDVEPVVLAGTAVEGFSRSDRVATYTPLRGEDIDVIYDTPLRTGTFEGSVDSSRGQDVWAALDTIDALRRSRTRKARMVWGSQSILVRLRDPDATSHSEITASNLMHAVRFGFVQVGE